MNLSHPYCQNTECHVCFREHIMLGDYLDEKCETNNNIDHLGKYHKWMSDNGFVPETEYGWASPETFNDNNIEAYIKNYLESDI